MIYFVLYIYIYIYIYICLFVFYSKGLVCHPKEFERHCSGSGKTPDQTCDFIYLFVIFILFGCAGHVGSFFFFPFLTVLGLCYCTGAFL